MGAVGIRELAFVILGAAATPSPGHAQASPVAGPGRGSIEGTVYDSLVVRAPLGGATVYLAGTPVAATADARGRFAMNGIPGGDYTLTFAHPALDSAGVLAPQVPVRVPAAGVVRVQVTTPAPRTVLAANCPEPRDEQTGLLLGTVRDVETGAPIRGARVATRWFELSIGRGGTRHDNMEASAWTDSAGVYRLCGIPTDIPVLVRALAGTQQSGRVEVYAGVSSVTFRDFAVSLTDTAARVIPDSVLDVATDSAARLPAGSARLAGTVRDEHGRALANVSVSILDRPGAVRSNAEGGFFVGGVPAGSQTVELKAIGFGPARRVVVLRGDSPTVVSLTLDRAVPTLATVRVLGRRAAASRSRSGFEERRRSAAGWSMDAEEVARTGAIYLGDLLRKAPGMAPSYNRRGERSYTMRSNWSGQKCAPTYFLDGVQWFPLGQPAIVELDRFISTHEVYGIEVYRGGSSTPAQFDRGTGCGVVLIWTK